MIYTGDYQSNKVYGTQNNRKINVKTLDAATFLSVKLNVLFNSEVWTHTFEIPFFKNSAEFYFENYIHSIITQKFELESFNSDNYKFYHFDIASITMTLKEMRENTELSTVEKSFYMISGKHQPLLISNLNSTEKRLLNVNNSKFITQKGILCFSFLSSILPNKILIDDGTATREINLPRGTTNKKLHTLTIPAQNIVSQNSASLILTLKFAGNIIIELGKFNIIDNSIDHNLLIYQNSFGTISTIEFIGQFIESQQFKSKISEYVNENSTYLRQNEIEQSKQFSINTGYIIDAEKYNMLYDLLKSFNIFMTRDELKQIIINGSQKLKPYKSNYYLNNETLKFKLTENDDIYYSIF